MNCLRKGTGSRAKAVEVDQQREHPIDEAVAARSQAMVHHPAEIEAG